MTRLLQLLYLMLISSSFEVLPFQPSPLLCFSSNPKKSLSFLATPSFLCFFLFFNFLLKNQFFLPPFPFPPDHHLPSLFFSSPKSSLFQPSSSEALHSSHHSLFRVLSNNRRSPPMFRCPEVVQHLATSFIM